MSVSLFLNSFTNFIKLFFFRAVKILKQNFFPKIIIKNPPRVVFSKFNKLQFNSIKKSIILLSRIAILLLKGCFEREKIILHKKNFKHRKIILLINFIFDPTFFLIASYQILKNCVRIGRNVHTACFKGRKCSYRPL